MTRSLATALILAAFASLSPVPTQAQLGGLIKKKVTDAVKGQKPAEPKKTDETGKPSQTNEPGYVGNSDVLEITQPTFEAILGGLKKELELQAAFKKEIARYPTRQEYEACKVRSAQSPEGQKIMSALYTIPQNSSADDVMKIQMKMGADMDALAKKACPLDPNDWNDYRIHQHLDSLRVQAAESITIAQSPSSPTGTAIAYVRFEILPLVDVAHTFFISEQQYGVALERIENLCSSSSGGILSGADTLNKKNPQKNPRTGAPLRIPGIGKDIYWVYTGNEASVLTPANCKRYKDLANKLMK